MKMLLSNLSNVNYLEIDYILEQFNSIVTKYNVAEKIMDEFQKFSEQYLNHDNYLKVAEQQNKYSFNKNTSHLTTSMKTFNDFGKPGNPIQSKGSIPDLTARINNVLRRTINKKLNMLYVLGFQKDNKGGSSTDQHHHGKMLIEEEGNNSSDHEGEGSQILKVKKGDDKIYLVEDVDFGRDSKEKKNKYPPLPIITPSRAISNKLEDSQAININLFDVRSSFNDKSDLNRIDEDEKENTQQIKTVTFDDGYEPVN